MCAKTKIIFICVFLCFSCKEEISLHENNSVIQAKFVTAEKTKNEKDLISFGIISYSVKNDISSQVQGSLQEIFVKDGESVDKNQLLGKLKNIQLEIQLEQARNSVKTAEANVLMAKTSLENAKLSIESRLINLERIKLQINHMELKLEDAKKKLENSQKLFNAGGMTQVAYSSQELSVKTMESELEILKKDLASAALGLRDEDLINNGYIPSEDKFEKKSQLIELNTRTSFAELEAAFASLENAKKNLISIEKLVSELEIRATCKGVVGGHYFEKGEYVSENEKIFTLIEIDKVHGVFSVQENDIRDVSVNSMVQIEIPALEKIINTEILEISPMADAQTGNFNVKAEVDNTSFDIKPGMFIKCKIPRKNAKELITLPESVLLNPEEDTFIFVVKNGIAIKRKIEIVNRTDGKIWILNDEALLNEKIIDNPSAFLKEGCRVE